MLLHSIALAALLSAAGTPIDSRMLVTVSVTPVAPVDESLEDIAIGDFNCDGEDDVAAPTYLGRVLVANGPWSRFTVTAALSGAGFLRGAATGRFNDDDCDDFAAVDSAGWKTVAMLGAPRGLRSAVGSPFDTPLTPWGLDVADFNGDGRDDVVSAAAGSDLAHLYLADGNGGLSAAGTWPLGRNSIHVQARDLDGNQTPDLFSTNHNVATGTILLNDGAGGFAQSAGSPISLPLTPCRPFLTDLDIDGDLDALVLSGERYQIALHRGDGHGGFSSATTIGVGLPFGCAQYAVSDLDGDGLPDVVIPNHDQIQVLYQRPDGSFRSAKSEAFVGLSFRGLVVHDFDGDGRDEVVAAGRTDLSSVIVVLAAPLFATGFE